MNNIKIALCQMNVADDKEKNIKKAIEMIKDAKKQNADLAILPEMFNCPYENEKFVEYAESLENSKTIKEISKVAKEEKIHVLAGSIPELAINKNKENSIYNTSIFIDENGKTLAKHRKVHLFDIDVKDEISFKESDTLSPGNGITIVETPFATIGIGICYDIRFVELSRIMALNGAEILIFPGAFNLTTGPAHWKILFKSRALDNQTYAIGVAPALNKEANYSSYGHSIVASPWGEIIEELNYDEELKVIDLNLDEIKRVREEIPILKNRRDDLYEIKEK